MTIHIPLWLIVAAPIVIVVLLVWAWWELASNWWPG